MNIKLENFKKNIKGKKIAVIGIGVSNIPAIKYLNSCGAYIYAHDLKENLDIEELKKLDNIEFKLGKKAFCNLNNVDYIFRSPGVKPFEKEIEEAVSKGVILTSEIEELVNLAPCKIIGVTGSAGKTTTTTLISKFFENSSKKVWVGGNIGIPLFDKLELINEDDIIVLELSSFQLMTMKKSPNISIITNIYEDHLDYHRNFEEYVEAKVNIFLHQKSDDICILWKEDKYINRFLNIIKENNIENNIRYFSTNQEVSNGAFLKEKSIYIRFKDKITKVIDVDNIKIKGEKNYLNICASICAVIDFVPIDDIISTLTNFDGVEHRLEFVATKNGVDYYNDSISTTPGKASACLTSFSKKIIIIAGGSDKNVDYTEYGNDVIEAAKYLILMGVTKDKIKKAVISSKKYNNNIKIYEVSNMDEAVKVASEISKKDDIVVMSPASASFDMYKSYKDRGNHFKTIVKNL